MLAILFVLLVIYYFYSRRTVVKTGVNYRGNTYTNYSDGSYSYANRDGSTYESRGQVYTPGK